MIHRRIRSFAVDRPSLLMSLVALATVGMVQSVEAQQEPVTVVAVSSVDGLLDDVDAFFEAGEAPQYAELVRSVIGNLNGLSGIDRSRPFGAYLYFPIAGEKEPQALLFFPVSDVDELVNSIKLGEALRIEKQDEENRLILHTEDGELPITVRDGYAFLDPAKSGTRFEGPLVSPDVLLQGQLTDRDGVLLVRREGIPPFVFELVIGQMRAEALKNEEKKPNESQIDYEIRRGVEKALFSLIESTIREWRGATVSWNFSAQTQRADINVHVAMKPSGETTDFLKSIRIDESRFAAQLAEPAAFSLATMWQPTQTGRDLLRSAVDEIRMQMTKETAEAGPDLQAAVSGLIAAIDSTAADGDFDAFAQLVGAPPNGFVLVAASAIAKSEDVATGLEHLLPFAVESKDIRQVEMSVARAGDVAIHKLVPETLRKRDQRLYGEDAAIYLAVGSGAVWMAIGGDGTTDLLADTILAGSDKSASANAGKPVGQSDEVALLNLLVHASDWVGYSRIDGGKKPELAQLSRQAFENPDEDTFHLRLSPSAEGLDISISADRGYLRMLALAVAANLDKK